MTKPAQIAVLLALQKVLLVAHPSFLPSFF
jgi:hypothetical protein